MTESEEFLTWDELLQRWGIKPPDLVSLLCRMDGAGLRPASCDSSLDYVGFRPTKPDFAGWDTAFRDVRFSLRDVEAYEKRFPELLPSRSSSSTPKSKKQRPQFPDSQRHYWRCRAVARVLWQEDQSMTAAQIAASAEIARFGCEDKINVYGLDVVEKWITDVCRVSYKDEDHDDPAGDHELFESKPKMRPVQRHRERARAVAALVWSRNPDITIADMIVRNEVNRIACEGGQRIYNETVLRRWIKDLRPQGQPTGRPKSNRRLP